VYVKSDARAKYGDVVAVVDEIRSAGVDQVGLLTERNERNAPPPPPPPRTRKGAQLLFVCIVVFCSFDAAPLHNGAARRPATSLGMGPKEKLMECSR